jgi:hypothetical protein
VDLIGYSVTELPEEVRAHPSIRIQPVLTPPAALSALPGLPRYFLKAALQVREENQHINTGTQKIGIGYLPVQDDDESVSWDPDPHGSASFW